MSKPNIPPNRRAFHCTYCGGQILIPKRLAATSGPCPHCSKTITSPPPEDDDLDDEDFAAPVAPRLTNRAGIPKKLDASHIVDDLDDLDRTPIKLGADQYADENPAPKPAKPRRVAPNKPVISRSTGEADKTADHHTPFEQFLIEEARSHTRAMILTTALIVLLLGLGGGGYYYYFLQQQNEPQQIDVADTPEPVAEPLSAEFINGGWLNSARQQLRKYIAATTPYGKLPHVLHQESILPELEKFYGGNLINDLDTPAEAFEPNPLSIADHERGLFRMSFRGTPPTSPETPPKLSDISRRHIVHLDQSHLQPTSVDAFFMHTPEGLLLDWHVFTQTKYRTLLRFAMAPSPKRKQTFRVLIVQDTPDESAPDNPNVRYRITDPANKMDAIRAWCDPKSPAGKVLSSINWIGTPNGKPVTRTATIELAWRGDGDQRQLVVHNFICWEFLGLGGTRPAPADPTP